MHNNIKYSIIIPTYNYAAYLPDAINSVLDQDYPGTEILVIDDASTDNTPEVANAYKGRIIYHRLEKNIGASGAWSYGLQRARGEYLCKLDADDQQMSGYLKTVDNVFVQDQSIGLVATSVRILINNNKLAGTEKLVDEDITLSPEKFRERLLQEFFFRMPGVCMRRSITVSHDAPMHNLFQIHDWEYFLRVTKGYKARLIAKPLAIYRIHDRSITKTALHENILAADCTRWLDHAVRQGSNYMDEDERNILAGSLAILVMRGIRLPYTPKKIIRYLAVRKIAMIGGRPALHSLHGYMFNKGFNIILKVFNYLLSIPRRFAKWSGWRLNRGYELFCKGGFASGMRFVREESKNTWIALTKRLPVDESQIRVECNLCGWRGKGFQTHCGAGYIVYDCICPACGSFPRHRGYAYVIENYLKSDLRKINSADGIKLLFAPEFAVYGYLLQYINDLAGLDYSVINSMVNFRANIIRLPIGDNSVSFLSCFHVIEHIANDRAALAELNRVLHVSGKAIICVPVNFDSVKTIEFGKPNPLLEDHYFDYGMDFGERLTGAGFKGKAFRLSKIMPKEMFAKHALQDELIFILQKTIDGENPVVHDHEGNIIYGQ